MIADLKNTTRLVYVSAIFVIIAALATIFQDDIRLYRERRTIIENQKKENKKALDEYNRIKNTPIMDYRRCNWEREEGTLRWESLTSDYMEKCQKRIREVDKKWRIEKEAAGEFFSWLVGENCYLREFSDLIKD